MTPAPPDPGAKGRSPPATTFVFADLAGFTALTEAHGDHDAADLVERFEGLASDALVGSAELVKVVGDAVMIVAEDAGDAVLTALSLRAAVDAAPLFPAVRVGLHSGPAVRRGTDYFGAAVNLAARVAARAGPGEVLVTGDVAAAAEAARLATACPLGPVRLRNVPEAVSLFELCEPERALGRRHVDPVCRMQLDLAPDTLGLRVGGREFVFCSFDCLRRFAADPAAYGADT